MGGLVSWRPKIGLILAVKASWVLALSAVLVFGFSLGARANPITNVTINGQPADDSQDNLSVPELGGNVILPGGASGLIPENNEVVVYGTVSPAFHGVIGGASLTANSVNNSLMVNGSGFINGTVLGGVASGTYNATDNRVVIDAIGGIFQNLGSLSNSGNVFGGYVMNGTAKNNLVTIFNGNVSAKVVGGATRYNGQVLSNQVVINGLGVKVGSVYGGQSLDSGRVENNVVTILNGSVQGDAIGGDLANSNGLVNNNAVFLYNGSIGGNIYGGYNHLAPTAVLTNVTNNQVIIHGGAVNHNIIGGEAFYGPADYNTVHLDNVTAAVQTSRSNTNIYGGLSQTWSATGNQVIIKRMANLLQVRQIFGGETKTDGNVAENLVNVATVNATGITGGQTYLGDAIHNQVRVEDSLASTIMGGVSQEGDVTNNSVVVVNSTLSGSAGMVAGGYSTNGTVVSNAAYLRNVTVVNSVTGGAVGGYSSLNGDVNNNKIVVSDSKISGKGVIGGYSTKGSVANSLAEVIASSVTNVSGGYVSLKGAVNNSSSKVVASNVSGTVYGGYSANGSIAKGATTVTDSNVTGNVYGGYTEEGPVADSSAIIIASEALNVGGGYSASGPVINGQVGVIESDIRGNVSGGYAEDGPVTNGKATVADSNVTGNIYGGYAEDGPVLDSLAWIESSNASNVYGGYAEDGPVTNGKATVTDSKVTGNVYGGYAEDGPVLDSLAWIESSNASNVYGGYAEDGPVLDSLAWIESSNASNVYGGYAEDGPVTNGKATVTDSNVTGNVYGGYAEDGPVLDSLVLLMDSNASNVYGGYSENGPVTNGHVGVIESDIRGNVSGGYSKNGSVTSGSALVSFSAVNQDVYGGYALNGSANDNDVEVIESVANRVIGGYSDDYGDAVSNSVLVDSSAIATVIGGYSEVGGANNNYVVLTGNSTVSTLLAGGKMGSGSNGDAYVKNTLVLWDYEASATPIPLVNNFQYYNYYLPSTVDDGFVALRATTVDLGPNPAVQWIEIDAQYGIPEIYNGEEIILIDASSIAGNFPLSAVVADIGFFFEKDFEVSLNAAKTQLIATVASPYRVKDRAKIVTETSAARLALLTQGQDYLVDHGLSLAKARADTPDDLVAFAGTSVTRGRYATGSHVDLTGVNGLIGVSKGQGVAGNHLTFGLFSEFGFGVYDAYVRAQGEGVEAEGDVSYVGAGLLGRYDIPANFGSYYLEASTRFGKSKADFVSKAGFNGRKLRFETSGSYAGFHLGGGLVYKITEATDIDLNLRYLWNRQQGSKERLLGQKFTLDDVESSRVRTGVRLSHKVNDYVKLYVGGAYIYELAGETGGHVIGLSLPSASLRGATGLTEVGLTLLKPVTFPISLDLGIQGYFGRRKGLAGALQLNYEF